MNPDLGEQFEQLRPRLVALAYRILGTTTDAEDAVQDAYLRYHRHAEAIQSPESWLVRVVTRLCIDRKRACQREAYIGNWLPEPVPDEGYWMEDPAELSESLSMAFMVMLETLSPVERAAYLLRDIFSYDFDEVADLIEKSPDNARQIVVRARRRLGLHQQRFESQPQQADQLAHLFFQACRKGDLEPIKTLLAEDATLISDGGGNALASPRPIRGQHRIANLLAVNFRKDGQAGYVHFSQVGKRPTVAIYVDNRPISVISLAIDEGVISKIYVMRNPEKLRLWNHSPKD